MANIIFLGGYFSGGTLVEVTDVEAHFIVGDSLILHIVTVIYQNTITFAGHLFNYF